MILDFRPLPLWVRLRLAFAIVFKTAYKYTGPSPVIS